jgi:hypothetical protein
MDRTEKKDASSLEKGQLACLVNSNLGFAHIGIIEKVEREGKDFQTGRYEGRVIIDGVTIADKMVEVGPFRFKHVARIIKPTTPISPIEIPTRGWDAIYHCSPDSPENLINDLQSNGYTTYAEFLTSSINR